MTPLHWILSNDTGTSSETIWAVMMGVADSPRSPLSFSVPWDPSDFGRCYRLLVLFPEWRARLPEVAEKFPSWGPLVREWDELSRLYQEERPRGSAPKLYGRMKELLAEVGL